MRHLPSAPHSGAISMIARATVCYSSRWLYTLRRMSGEANTVLARLRIPCICRFPRPYTRSRFCPRIIPRSIDSCVIYVARSRLGHRCPKLNTMAKAAHPESIESVSFFIFLPSFKNDRGQYSEECCSKKNWRYSNWVFLEKKIFFIILRIKDTHIAYDSLHTFHHPDVRWSMTS